MFIPLTKKFSSTVAHYNPMQFAVIHVHGLNEGATTVELTNGDIVEFEETIRIDSAGRPFVYDHAEYQARIQMELDAVKMQQMYYEQSISPLTKPNTSITPYPPAKLPSFVSESKTSQPSSILGRLFGQTE